MRKKSFYNKVVYFTAVFAVSLLATLGYLAVSRLTNNTKKPVLSPIISASVPVSYQQLTKQPVDNEVTAQAITSVVATFQKNLKPETEDQKAIPILVSSGKYQLSFYPLAVQTSNSLTNSNKIIYPEAFSGADLEYEVFRDLVKETILVKTEAAQSNFSFQFFVSQDTEFVQDDQGGIIVAAAGAARFYLQPVTAYDETGKNIEFKYILEKNDQGYLVKVAAADPAQLRSARFPVTIDPTISWQFLTSPGYTLSDISKIEIIGGVIRLKNNSGTYATDDPYAVTVNSLPYTALTGFSETLGSGNQGTVQYQLSQDGSSWYWYSGSGWVVASPADFDHSNTAAVIDANIADFATQLGSGNLYVKIFLHAPSSTSSVELTKFTVNYSGPSAPGITDISPVSGPSAGDTDITITGSNFYSADFGSGADGSITVSANKNINIDNIASGRTCADAVNYSVTALNADTATLASTPAEGCLESGDEVLLISLQGTGSYYGNVGNYETLVVQSIEGSTVTFTANKSKYYGNGVSDDTNIGTAATNQRVMLQRIPNYIDVTVNSGITLTADAWDGTKGGVFYIRAKGTITNVGVVDMTGKGYHGGTASGGSEPRQAWQGESRTGPGGQTTDANDGGGGGMRSGVACNYPASGGGGYSTSGGNGTSGDCGTVGNGGASYGSTYLTTLFFGSGGGGESNYGGYGGYGGGIIYINANNINVTGSITANGTNGSNTNIGSGPGGGGAGGSIYIASSAPVLGSSLVTGNGGTGGSDGAQYGDGGNGSAGRIAVYYLASLSGITSPAAYQQQQSLNDSVLSVMLGGIEVTDIVWVNATTLTAKTTAHSAGTVDMTVTNPDGQSETLTSCFTFIDPPGSFTITPNSVLRNGGTSITVNGSNFTGTPLVTFGGVLGTNVERLDANTLTVTTPAHALGNADVVVTNEDGQTSTLVNGVTFTELSPTVSAITPALGSSAGGTDITITGSNFFAADYGSGTDGWVTLTANKNINSDNIAAGRICADAINYSVTALSTDSATLASTPASGCLANGDEVLLINLQGTAANYDNVGNYELLKVLSINDNVITFTANKIKYYGNAVNDDTNLGTARTNQRVMLQRVPNYLDVTINSGVTLTADTWNGVKGGVLFFRVNGTLVNNGIINMTGKGYLGGSGVYTSGHTNGQGESYLGLGSSSSSAASVGGGGGGGSLCTEKNTSGGGGGSYATAGSIGGMEGSCGRGTGSEVSYGSQDLQKMYFGGGGGGSYVGNSTYHSGGIVGITAKILQNEGSILANGDAGTGTGNEPAGSGAGGSIKISGENIAAGTVSADGGLGFSWYDGLVGSNTGAGGAGRIALFYSGTVSGTTSPEAYEQMLLPTDVTVNIGGTPVTNVQLVDQGTITATTGGHSAGLADVTVTNYDGQSDTLTGSFEYLPANFTLANIPAGLSVLDSADWLTDLGSTGIPANTNVSVGIKNVSYRIAVFDVLLTGDADWNGLTAESDNTRAVFIYDPAFADIPGRNSSSYTLYIPAVTGIPRVGVCPDVSLLSEVTPSCNGFYFLTDNATNNGVTATLATEDGVAYWKLSGLTVSAGAISDSGYLVINPPENISVVSASDNTTLVTSVAQSGTKEVIIKSLDNKKIASFELTFANNDLDWSNLVVTKAGNKALFHFPGGFASLPGVTGVNPTYILYIPKGHGDKVQVCPGAENLAEITVNCGGGFQLSSGQTRGNITATLALDDGTETWEVSGLTGTGAMSVISGLKDTLTSLQISSPAVQVLTLGTNNGLLTSTDSITITFDPATHDFDLTGLTVADISATADGAQLTLAAEPGASVWGVTINTTADQIIFQAPASGTYLAPGSSLAITIGVADQIINPATSAQYQVTIQLNNTASGIESGEVALPIVDSDQVDISGAVTSSIVFDIDTGTADDINCTSNTCQTYEGGPLARNYLVDLGELKSVYVNRSQSAVVAHSDAGTGKINSVYFDLSTNAASGALVYLVSANGSLLGPGTDKIPAVTDGNDITINSNTYGYTLTDISELKHGSFNLNINCSLATAFCGPKTTPVEIVNTNNQQLDPGRIRIDLAAAPGYTDQPGVYTDTLTLIAVAAF